MVRLSGHATGGKRPLSCVTKLPSFGLEPRRAASLRRDSKLHPNAPCGAAHRRAALGRPPAVAVLTSGEGTFLRVLSRSSAALRVPPPGHLQIRPAPLSVFQSLWRHS